MTRRATMRAEVRVVRMAETLAEARAGLLFAARGEWIADEHALAPNAEAHLVGRQSSGVDAARRRRCLDRGYGGVIEELISARSRS